MHADAVIASYSVYIVILILYFALIYLMFPETKRLSAEDASMAFDGDMKVLPLQEISRDVESSDNTISREKQAAKIVAEDR